MTAPTLSRERAIVIARKHAVEEYGVRRAFACADWIIAAIQDAFAAGVATGEADRRDAERYRHARVTARLASHGEWVLLPDDPHGVAAVSNNFDADIDAALAQTKQEE